MRIANLLYDHAFKFLMSNNRLARKVLSIILDENVVKLQLNQQEVVQSGILRGLRVFRLDFKATIEMADGSREQVLIELQKSKLPTNVHRFRNYLGSAYSDQSGPDDDLTSDEGLPEALPIISIYILGYNIDDLPHLATQIDRQVIDAVSGKKINVESQFVHALTHKSYILQVKRLPDERRTRLEQFLNFFNQAYVADKNYILDLDDVPAEFRDIADYLQKPLNKKEMARQFTIEDEMELYFKIVDAEKKRAADALEQLQHKLKKLHEEMEELTDKSSQLAEEKDRLTEEKDLLTEEKDRLAKEKDLIAEEKEQIHQANQRLKKEVNQLKEQAFLQEKLARFMLTSTDMNMKEIAAETGLSLKAIEELKTDS